jgi:hypothetical protein
MKTNMSVNKQVWHILQTDPSIMKDYSRKLINVRALSRYLIDNYGLDASLDAVISSIRRFPLQDVRNDDRILASIFKDAEVSTKNNISCITINGEPHEILPKLSTIKLPPLRVSTGSDKVKLIMETDEVEKTTKPFKQKEVVRNLSEISITVSERAIKTKGVLARITSELSLAGINIYELFVCPPQFLIYVAQDDILKAHERILSLAMFK